MQLAWYRSGVSARRAASPQVGLQQEPIYRAKAEFFRLLGHPARVRILELLQDGERTVGDLQAELGLDSSGTSQHLGTMRRQGVLESRRAGNERVLPGEGSADLPAARGSLGRS